MSVGVRRGSASSPTPTDSFLLGVERGICRSQGTGGTGEVQLRSGGKGSSDGWRAIKPAGDDARSALRRELSPHLSWGFFYPLVSYKEQVTSFWDVPAGAGASFLLLFSQGRFLVSVFSYRF